MVTNRTSVPSMPDEGIACAPGELTSFISHVPKWCTGTAL